jgi:hypothetical protein
LPGFDENYYVNNTEATARSIQDLLAEFSAVSFNDFLSFSEDQLIGIASNVGVSVRAIGFIMIGHQNTHLNIFQERYL